MGAGKSLKVLLTGGSGMVGRNIIEHSATTSWDLHAPSRTELDLRDYSAVQDWMLRERPDAVIHAAGVVGGIEANIADPVGFLVANVDVGRNVILGACEAGVAKLINLASSCMYPRAAPNPLREEMLLTGELEPTNEGYALAKIFCTRLCQYIRRESPERQFKTLIPCNLYGRYDSFAPERSHLIPAIVRKVHEALVVGSEAITIWGDGTARREFLFASDLAGAVINALINVERLPDLMNIGYGEDFTVEEYYRTVADVIGWHGSFQYDLSRPVGMKQKLVCIERQTTFGWAPTTSLRDGVSETYHFFTQEYGDEL